MAVRWLSVKLKSHTKVGGVSLLLHSFSHYYQPQQQPADSLKDICGVISSSQLADVHYIINVTKALLGQILRTAVIFLLIMSSSEGLTS